MQPHTRHFFVDELADRGPFSQVRLNVFPDGGVSRLRLWGVASEAGRRQEAVRRINAAPDPIAELKACCGSSKWAEAMAAARPFASWDRLTEAGDRAWSSLSPDDWMEAFRAHPRIGAGDSSPSAGLGMTRGWSAQEQAGARDANRETLADANRAYEQKFGHIFLICATGRSAQDILDNLRARMNNDSKTELRVAGEEQRKITALRLEKLVT
jgi:allantoicase